MLAAAPDAPLPPVPAPLSRRTKLAYGMGDLGAAVVTTITGFFLTAFLLDVVGLRPGLVGVIFLISQLWDALIDPPIGLLTDRTRSRWGRKRPWLLWGALPFGVAYVLHWVVPPLGQTGLFVYYLLVSLLLRTAYSAVNIPYAALAADLTQDYNERTRLTTYRFSFSIFGGLLAAIGHPILVGLGGENAALGNVISAAFWGVFIVLTVLAAFRWTYEPPVTAAVSNEKRDGLYTQIRQCFQNRPFLLVTGIYLFSWLALLLIQNNLLLYVRYWANAEDAFPTILVTFQVSAILFLSVWSRLSVRLGKREVYVLGVGLWVATIVALFFIPQGMLTPYYAVAFFGGAGAAVAYLIPWSMLPDVVEYDTIQTGQRREGLFYGMFVLMQQAGLSLGLAGSSFALEAAGYLTPSAGQAITQPPAVLTTLRVLVSLAPAVILLCSIPLALRYPLTRERFTEIQRQARERQGN